MGRTGMGIPILSPWLAKRAIAAREDSIAKIDKKVSNLVKDEKAKIDKAVEKAEKTNKHDLIVRAHKLREKLEDAACAKMKFDTGDEMDEPTMSKEEAHRLTEECIAATNAKTGQDRKGPQSGPIKDPVKIEAHKKWVEEFENCKAMKGIE